MGLNHFQCSSELRIVDRKLVAYINPDEHIIGGIQGVEWAIYAVESPN